MRFRVLTKKETGQIHKTALRILREIGMDIHDNETQKRLKDIGCQESENRYLIFPEGVVEEAIQTVRAIVENTTKPLDFLGHKEVETAQVWQYLADVAGGWESLSRKPFAINLTGPTSPLKQGEEACRRLRFAASKCLPVVCFPAVMPGATAPVTLSGALAQTAAEILGGIVVHQMERPGAPVISGAAIIPLDMRTGNICYGAPEYALICQATVDYLRDIGIPSWTGSGCSDAHTVDSQAAAEAGMNILLSALTATSWTHNLGFLSSGKTGSFIVEDHTLNHVRTAMWIPSLIQRMTLTKWTESGTKSMRERIREKLKILLNE